MFGTLTIVAVPIGNFKDMSPRAIEVLLACDVILCEDLKPARRLLHEFKIVKELVPLNEHTSRQATAEAIELLQSGKHLALISDAGTPLIADPGSRLVETAIKEGIEVTIVPGASSVLLALVLSGFPLDKFYFAGFLPRDKDERKQMSRELSRRSETIALLEAPYRLSQLLDDLIAGFGEKRDAVLAIDITTPKERTIRGNLLEIREEFALHPFKGEFVVVLRGAPDSRRGSHPHASTHRRPTKRH